MVHQPRLQALELHTHLLPELRAFYAGMLGFPIVAETPEAVTFQAGASRLTFSHVGDGSHPYYHIAFNIPENKLEQAKTWLAARAPILRHAVTGDDVIHFPAWDAHALFFYDPAGSLLELIARHTLPNASDGPFDTDDLLSISEIALRAPDPGQAAALVREAFGLRHYLDLPSFLGDEQGLIIFSPPGRLWIPEFRKAGATFPTRITLAGHGSARLTFPDAPFEIVGVGRSD